eukprot:1077976-Alexandrium_andersonii.AAC.1
MCRVCACTGACGCASACARAGVDRPGVTAPLFWFSAGALLHGGPAQGLVDLCQRQSLKAGLVAQAQGPLERR